MTVGRNDPCPYGSGRKFKKCHGLSSVPDAMAQDPVVVATRKAQEADTELVNHLLRFARRREGEGWLQDVLEVYSGDWEAGDADFPLAIPMALYHIQSGTSGTSIGAQLRDEPRSRLPAELRSLLDAQLSAWLAVWEVREVQPGVGLSLHDLLTGESRYVIEHSASLIATVRMALLARVVDHNGISFIGGAHQNPLRPEHANTVVAIMRQRLRVRTRPVRPDKLRDVRKQLLLLDTWRAVLDEAYRPRPMPTVTNTDGDVLQPTTDHFEFTDGNARIVVKKLESFEGVQEAEVESDETVFVVTKPGNKQMRSWDNTVIARLVVKGTRLSAESNSTRRANALRKRLEKHLRGLVFHRLREETSQDSLMAEARRRGQGGAPTREKPEVPPEVQAMVREMKEQHMASWVDESIPALGGLTPRQASASKEGRGTLDVLLRDIEYQEGQLPAAERVDMAKLRRVLGMGEG